MRLATFTGESDLVDVPAMPGETIAHEAMIKRTSGAGNGYVQIVALNAGAALYVANLVGSIPEGITKAQATIASGAARAKLEEFVACTRRFSQPA